MNKRVYISADYDEKNGDRNVADLLNIWGRDNYHKVNFVDTAKVISGSVSNNPDCRICDLKDEFNSQINISSAVIFIIGDKTADRTAGSACDRLVKTQSDCYCTPYKHNSGGTRKCKVVSWYTPGENENFGNINPYSYIRHEFMQATRKEKKIIILYNSMRFEEHWLPSYMKDYKDIARPFWIWDKNRGKVGDYEFIKKELGFE